MPNQRRLARTSPCTQQMHLESIGVNQIRRNLSEQAGQLERVLYGAGSRSAQSPDSTLSAGTSQSPQARRKRPDFHMHAAISGNLRQRSVFAQHKPQLPVGLG